MFILASNPNEAMQKVLKHVARGTNTIPPHFELFATLHPKRFEMFLEEIFYLSMHKSINPDFFAMQRFYVAAQKNFNYCYEFNKMLLLSKGYTQEQLEAFEKSVDGFMLDDKHKLLFETSLIAINQPERFNNDVIKTLEALGWTSEDIFDAIDHAAFMFKFSKVLKAYMA